MLMDSEWASKCAQICIMFKFGEDYIASKVDIHRVQDLVCLIICLCVCHASWFHAPQKYAGVIYVLHIVPPPFCAPQSKVYPNIVRALERALESFFMLLYKQQYYKKNPNND